MHFIHVIVRAYLIPGLKELIHVLSFVTNSDKWEITFKSLKIPTFSTVSTLKEDV
jgi:hypothetical protein